MVPAVAPVVNVTVATPPALVVLVGLPNDPPAPVLVQVTVLPAVATGLLFASANCAVIVMALPANGLLLLELTRYLAAGRAVVIMLPLVTVRVEFSIPVIV